MQAQTQAPVDIHGLSAAIQQSERKIRTWRQAGKIPFLKIGHRTHLYNVSKVLAALQKFEVREVKSSK